MRNFLILALTFIGLCSCTVEVPYRDGPKTISLEGVLTESEAGVATPNYALNFESGGKTLLSSLAIDLSRPDYLGNLVNLTGFYKDGGLFEVTGISVTEVRGHDLLAGEFLPYLSSKYGFALSYFSNWKIEELDNLVSFTVKEGSRPVASFMVSILPYPFGNESVDFSDASSTQLQALTSFMTDSGVDMNRFIDKRVGVDAYAALYDSVDGSEVYYLYRSGFVYKIALNGAVPRDEKFADLRNQFLSTLATFKFIAFVDSEQPALIDDTSSALLQDQFDGEMTSFESLPYMFRGQYPADWYYSGSQTFELGVMRHYGFSDEVVDSENELVTLDVLSTPLPTGEQISVSDRDFVFVKNGDFGSYFFTLGDNVFRVSSSAKYFDVALAIASSIEKFSLPDGN